MTKTRNIDFDGLVEVVSGRPAPRGIVAIAGAPGSGKSTLAESLASRLNDVIPGSADVLPMDGFHFDDQVLVRLGLRPRKGSPATFDVTGLGAMLGRLRDNHDAAVAVPLFDRALEIARAGARLIPRTARFIVAEGNYLLLDEAPWTALHPLFDVTVMIDCPEAVLRRRLTARWESYGLTPEEIDVKLEANDLPNGRLVATRSVAPHYRLVA